MGFVHMVMVPNNHVDCNHNMIALDYLPNGHEDDPKVFGRVELSGWKFGVLAVGLSGSVKYAGLTRESSPPELNLFFYTATVCR